MSDTIERPEFLVPTQEIVDELPNYFLQNIPETQHQVFEDFVNYCRINKAFAVKYLLGIDLAPYQGVILDAMFNIPYFILKASRGASKCVSGDTYIHTNRGYCRIADLVGNQKPMTRKYIDRLEIYGENGFNELDYCWNNGVTNNIKITTKTGRTLTITKDHKIRVFRNNNMEWCESQYLKIGDVTCILDCLQYEYYDNNSSHVSKIQKTTTSNDTIIKIEEVQCETFDVHLKTDHSFITNGFISHNTFMLAVYITLKSMLDQSPKSGEGVKVIITSASYRQAKLIFMEIKEHIYANAPLLQECCDRPPIMSMDHCHFTIGTSKIKALPLGNGETIRGERGNVIICDEFKSVDEEIFETVVAGFGAVATSPIEKMKIKAEEKRLRSLGLLGEFETLDDTKNQIIRAGTAYYQFNHFYKKEQKFREIIHSKITPADKDKLRDLFGKDAKMFGNLNYKDYGIIVLPHTQIPEGIMDENMLTQNRLSMSEILFDMEYNCISPSDSHGFFRMSSIEAASPIDEKEVIVERIGDPAASYVMGIDPARKVDNFAIEVLKIEGNYRKLVYAWTMNAKEFPVCVRKIREVMLKFNIVRIAMDTGGGGTTIHDLLHTKELMQEGEDAIWAIDDEENDHKAGRHILDMVNFSPKWIAEANYNLQADIDHKRILFPHTIHMDKYETGHYEELDDIFEEINDTKAELSKIVLSATDKSQVEHFDIPKVKGAPYERKDRYSALLLANYAANCFCNMEAVEIKTRKLGFGGWAHTL